MIRCTWTAPTKFKSGRTVKAGDITGYILRMKVDGAPSFTEIAKPAANATSFEVDVNDPGKYDFALAAVASNGKVSDAGTASVTIAETTALEAPVLTVAVV